MNKDTEFQGYLKNYVGFTYDIEADGFLFQSTKIWTIHFKDIQTQKSFKFNPFKMQKHAAKKKFLDVIDVYAKRGEIPKVIAHNGLGYDIFVLMKHLDIDFEVGKNGKDTIEGREVEFIDTFYLSMFLWPDRPRHGVEYFGTVMEFPKIDYREALIEAGALDKDAPKGAEFTFYHPLMEEYCKRDTDVGMMIFEYLLNQMHSLYGKCILNSKFFRTGLKSFFLMSCQEYSGFKFDVEYGKELAKQIEGMMLEIEQEVEPQLPARELGKTEAKEFTFPAKPWKQNGEFSSHMSRFIEKHNAAVFDDKHIIYQGKKYEIIPGEAMDVRVPMEMKNQDQMKDYFLTQGWIPTFYNYKRGPDGKPMRDPLTRQLIPTTPKIQEQGTICPNLLELDGDLPKKVVKWLSLRNRLSVLNGWLENERLSYDGRIGASRTGIAATHRQKHSVVVNVPKASEKVLLGKEFRSLWISEPNGKIAAGDAAAIEGRVQGHYCYRFDGGVTAEELLKGDVHSKNAKAFYGHLPEVAAIDIHAATFDKDDPGWKPYRDRSKNGFYSILYGAAAPKVASTLGIPEELGQKALDSFWESNPGTKKLKDTVEKWWSKEGQKKYLPAIDGRILHTRKKSALLNTIFQSCGGITMDYASCIMDDWLGKIYFDDLTRPYYKYKGCKVWRIGYFHDELEYEIIHDDATIRDEVTEEVARMIEKAIEQAGVELKIKVPLAGEGKTGYNWAQVH